MSFSRCSITRLEGILKTLKANLPEQAKDITWKDVSDFISSRPEKVAPGTNQKEVTALKYALTLLEGGDCSPTD